MPTIEDLVNRIQAGERYLLGELWDRVKPFIAYRAQSYLQGHACPVGLEVDDLVCASWEPMLQAVEHFDPEKRSKYTSYLNWWLLQAWAAECCWRTGRQAKDPLNHAASLEAPVAGGEDLALWDALEDPVDYAENVTDRVYQEELRHVVNAALLRLPYRWRVVAWARFALGLSRVVTAQRLGMTVAQVETAEHNARQRLRADRDLRQFWYQDGSEPPMHSSAERAALYNMIRERIGRAAL